MKIINIICPVITLVCTLYRSGQSDFDYISHLLMCRGVFVPRRDMSVMGSKRAVWLLIKLCPTLSGALVVAVVCCQCLSIMPTHGKMHPIQDYVMDFVSDLRWSVVLLSVYPDVVGIWATIWNKNVSYII